MEEVDRLTTRKDGVPIITLPPLVSQGFPSNAESGDFGFESKVFKMRRIGTTKGGTTPVQFEGFLDEVDWKNGTYGPSQY